SSVGCAAAVWLVLSLSLPAAAQQPETERFRVAALLPGGARTSLTESWGRLDFEITNQTDSDRQGRVLVYYENQPDVQYGRDVWVPAHATIASWLPIGPAPPSGPVAGRELRLVLYDMTGGKN